MLLGSVCSLEAECQLAIQDIVHQSRLSRSGNAGDHGKGTEGNGRVDFLEIVE